MLYVFVFFEIFFKFLLDLLKCKNCFCFKLYDLIKEILLKFFLIILLIVLSIMFFFLYNGNSLIIVIIVSVIIKGIIKIIEIDKYKLVSKVNIKF